MAKEAYKLAPWAEVARPDADVTSGALDMGTYAVNLARVFRAKPGVPEVYVDAERFFAATYFTEAMRQLVSDVLGVLAEGKGSKVVQLRTPFGGGKTHSLVALYHLAKSLDAAKSVPELGDLPDPGPTRVAVLSGEELDPLSSFEHPDGTKTKTLWGELAHQLGRYDLVEPHDEAGSAPGGDVLARVLGDGPVLILLDEVLVYVEKAMALTRGDSNLGRQAMIFLQGLTEVVNSRPRAALVYSLQASAGEAVGAEGLLHDLDHLVSRMDQKREPVSGDDVLRVVQRRLFEDLGDESVHREVARAYADLVRKQLKAQAETDDARREADSEAERMERRICESYPFHPAILDLMYHRWGSLPSYQRTRGALQFLACVIHALAERGDGSALIGPGEVDFRDEATRGAFFSQVGERESYTAVMEADILSEGSGAVVVDRRIGADAPALDQLRVGTRMATAIMLYSFGSREGEERGVLETDVVAGALVPGLDRNVIVAALHDLREEELYLHYTGRRYRFEPRPNLTKLIRDEANKFTPEEVLGTVREELEKALRGSRNVVIWPEDSAAVRDGVPSFTFAYLGPDWTPDAQPLVDLVEHVGTSRRRFKNAVGFVLPDGAQFDRARAAARSTLAVRSLLRNKARHGFSAEQAEELKEKEESAAQDLAAAVGRAYARVCLPVRDSEGEGAYTIEDIDLRSLLTAGRSLHDRTVEAVSHRVFDTLTADKLTSLVGLGPDRPFVVCSDIVEWFFSYFEFTKLTGTGAVRDVISRGVMEGKIAYAPGILLTDGELGVRDPKLVRIGEMVPAEEIDIGSEAAILTPEQAAKLTGQPEETEGPGPPEDKEPEASEVDGEGDRPGPTELVHAAALSITVEGGGFFALNRALSWLRENARSVEAEIKVRATSDEGFDQVRFRNGVIEPIEEGGGDVRTEFS